VKILKIDNDKKISVKKRSVNRKKSKVEEKSLVKTDIVQTDDHSSLNFIGGNSIDMAGHIDRFRSKLLITLLLFMILTPVAFYFSSTLLKYINKPFLATGNTLNIFTLMGGFMLKFKVSTAATLLILMPLIIYQIWSVVSDGVVKKSKMFSRVMVIIAVILFYAGVAAAFFLLLPLIVEMLLSYNHADMLSTVGADSYLSFTLLICLSMGVIFEVPIIIFVLTRMGIITPAMLSSKRRHAIVIMWILAALLTPPDVFSQVLVAVPLMIIFEISVLISKYVYKRQ
jgi:sec-independent protein translocase protein TatC